MPPQKAPPTVAAKDASRSEEKGLSVPEATLRAELVAPPELEALLDSLGVRDRDVAKAVTANDLSGVSDDIASQIANWYALRCGLNPSQVAVLKTRSGKICYVKASGVFEYARGKYRSISVDQPILFGTSTVVVFATVEMSDGSSVRLFAARHVDGANSLMACATAATVRALRVAVGIPLPSEGEL